jgi:hypothetical protein
MKVFVLYQTPEESMFGSVIGVFTTELGAKAARDEKETQFPFDNFNIEEATLNV